MPLTLPRMSVQSVLSSVSWRARRAWGYVRSARPAVVLNMLLLASVAVLVLYIYDVQEVDLDLRQPHELTRYVHRGSQQCPSFPKTMLLRGFRPRHRGATDELLLETVNILKQQKIVVMMHFGTVLGALRHHGSVPWDDDADVAVLSTDFERLVQDTGLHRAFADHGIGLLPKYGKTWVDGRWHHYQLIKVYAIDGEPVEKRKYNWPCMDIWSMELAVNEHGKQTVQLQSKFTTFALPWELIFPASHMLYDGMLLPASHRAYDSIAALFGSNFFGVCVHSTYLHSNVPADPLRHWTPDEVPCKRLKPYFEFVQRAAVDNPPADVELIPDLPSGSTLNSQVQRMLVQTFVDMCHRSEEIAECPREPVPSRVELEHLIECDRHLKHTAVRFYFKDVGTFEHCFAYAVLHYLPSFVTVHALSVECTTGKSDELQYTELYTSSMVHPERDVVRTFPLPLLPRQALTSRT